MSATYRKEKKSTKTIVGRLPAEVVEQQRIAQLKNETKTTFDSVPKDESITPELHRLRCLGNSFIKQWDMQPASVTSGSDHDEYGGGYRTINLHMGGDKSKDKVPKGYLKDVVQEDLEKWRSSSKKGIPDFGPSPRLDLPESPVVLTARSDMSREYTELELKQNPTLRRLQLVLRRIQMSEAIYREIIGTMTRQPRSDAERLEQLLALEQLKAILFVGRRYNLVERIETVIAGAMDAQARKLPHLAPTTVEDHLEDIDAMNDSRAEDETARPPPRKPEPEVNLMAEEKKVDQAQFNFLFTRRDLEKDDFDLSALRKLTGTIEEHVEFVENAVHPDVMERLTRPPWDYTMSESNFKEICWLIESLDLALTLDAFADDTPASKPKIGMNAPSPVAPALESEESIPKEDKKLSSAETVPPQKGTPTSLAPGSMGRASLHSPNIVEEEEGGALSIMDSGVHQRSQGVKASTKDGLDGADQTFLTCPTIFAPDPEGDRKSKAAQSSLASQKTLQNEWDIEEEPSLVGFSLYNDLENADASHMRTKQHIRQQRLLGLNLVGFMMDAVPTDAYGELGEEDTSVPPPVSSSSISHSSIHKVQPIVNTSLKPLPPLPGTVEMPPTVVPERSSSESSISEESLDISVDDEIAAMKRDQEVIQVFRLATHDKKTRKVLQLRPDLLNSMRKLYQLHNYTAFIDEIKAGARNQNRRTEEEWIADIEEKLRKKQMGGGGDDDDLDMNFGGVASVPPAPTKSGTASTVRSSAGPSQAVEEDKPSKKLEVPSLPIGVVEEPLPPVEEIVADDGTDILQREAIACGLQFVVIGKLSSQDAARRMAGMLTVDEKHPLIYEKVFVEVRNPTESYIQAGVQVLFNKLKNLSFVKGSKVDEIHGVRKNIPPNGKKIMLEMEPTKPKGKKKKKEPVSCENAFILSGRTGSSYGQGLDSDDDDATKYQPIPPVLSGGRDLFKDKSPSTWGKKSEYPTEDAILNNMNALSAVQMGKGTGKVNPVVTEALSRPKGKGKKDSISSGGGGGSKRNSIAPADQSGKAAGRVGTKYNEFSPTGGRGAGGAGKREKADNYFDLGEVTLTKEEEEIAKKAGIPLDQALENKKENIIRNRTDAEVARPVSKQGGFGQFMQGRRTGSGKKEGGVHEQIADAGSPFKGGSHGQMNRPPGEKGDGGTRPTSGGAAPDIHFDRRDIDGLRVKGYKTAGVDDDGQLVVEDKDGNLFVLLKNGNIVPAAEAGVTEANINRLNEDELRDIMKEIEDQKKYDLLSNPKRRPVNAPDVWQGGPYPPPTISITSKNSRPHSTAEVERFTSIGGIRFDLDDEDFKTDLVEGIMSGDYAGENGSGSQSQGDSLTASERKQKEAQRKNSMRTRSAKSSPVSKQAHNFIAEIAKMKHEAKVREAKNKEKKTVDTADMVNFHQLQDQQRAVEDAHAALIRDGPPPVHITQSKLTNDFEVYMPTDAEPSHELSLRAVLSRVPSGGSRSSSLSLSMGGRPGESYSSPTTTGGMGGSQGGGRMSARGTRSLRSLTSLSRSSSRANLGSSRGMGDSVSQAASLMRNVARDAGREAHARKGPRGVPNMNPHYHTGSEMEMLEQQARELYLLDPVRYNDVIDDLLQMAANRLEESSDAQVRRPSQMVAEMQRLQSQQSQTDHEFHSLTPAVSGMDNVGGVNSTTWESRRNSFYRRREAEGGRHGSNAGSGSVGLGPGTNDHSPTYRQFRRESETTLGRYRYGQGFTVPMHKAEIGGDFFGGAFSSELPRSESGDASKYMTDLANEQAGIQGPLDGQNQRRLSHQNIGAPSNYNYQTGDGEWTNDPASAVGKDDQYMYVRGVRRLREGYRSSGSQVDGTPNLGLNQKDGVDLAAQYYNEEHGSDQVSGSMHQNRTPFEGEAPTHSPSIVRLLSSRTPQPRQYRLSKITLGTEENHATNVEAGQTEVERIMFEQMKAKLLLRAVIDQMRALWAGRQNEKRKDKRIALEKQYDAAQDAAWELGRHRIINMNKLIDLADRKSGRRGGFIPVYSDANVFFDQYGFPMPSYVQRRVHRAMYLARHHRLLPMHLLRKDVQERWNQHLLFGYKKRIITLDEVNENRPVIRGRPETYKDMRTVGERMRYRRRLQRAAAFQRASCMYSPRTRREIDLPYSKLPF